MNFIPIESLKCRKINFVALYRRQLGDKFIEHRQIALEFLSKTPKNHVLNFICHSVHARTMATYVKYRNGFLCLFFFQILIFTASLKWWSQLFVNKKWTVHKECATPVISIEWLNCWFQWELIRCENVFIMKIVNVRMWQTERLKRFMHTISMAFE